MAIFRFDRPGLGHALIWAALALVAAPLARARAHPFMFYGSTDIATLKANTGDPAYADIFNEIKIDCRSRYGPSSSVNTQQPDRRYWEAIRSHAALLMLDPTLAGGSRYQSATQFTKYFYAVLDAPGWSDFFGGDTLLPPYLLAGLIVGYDMNTSAFSANARQSLIDKLADRADYLIGQTDTLNIPDDLNDPAWGYQSSFKVLRNKFVMAFSALGLIAYGLEGEVDEARRQGWLRTVEGCLAAWQSRAMADGVSLESYSYHELMSELLFMFLEVRTRVTGQNQFPLYPAAAQHPIYSIYSWIPGGDRGFIAPIPWGDCEPAPPADMRTNAAAVVRRLKGGASDGLAQLAAWMQYRPLNGTANNSYARADSRQYFTIDPAVAMKSPAALALARFHYFASGGTFVWRSSWDNMATYFAMTCAPQLGGHQAPEAGTFVIFKGGAPYIAPHFYLDNHLTKDHNVMLIEGQGQLGESSSSITTEPQPPAKWAEFLSVMGDDSFFNVLVDLKPAYASGKLTRYTREYVGFANCYFVRDATAASAAVRHESLLHAYKTTQPPAGDLEVLDPDSDPNANPWSGSNGTYSLKPRSSGPYTGEMIVNDLSAMTWTRSIGSDTVNKHSGGDGQRGYKLTLSLTGNAATALLGFSFPGADQSLLKWPGADGEGVKFVEGGYAAGVMVWPGGGAINGTAGLTMRGAMGGIHTTRGWLWGRDLSSLTYNNTVYFSATAPMSIFSTTLSASGNRIRVIAPQGGTLSVRCASPIKEVWLDRVKLGTTQWSQSGGMLKVSLANPLPSAALIELVFSAGADTGWMNRMAD